MMGGLILKLRKQKAESRNGFQVLLFVRFVIVVKMARSSMDSRPRFIFAFAISTFCFLLFSQQSSLIHFCFRNFRLSVFSFPNFCFCLQMTSANVPSVRRKYQIPVT